MGTVLVTGITGYIGSHLAQALLADHTVCGLAREPINRRYLPDELMESLRLFPICDGKSIRDAMEACRPDVVYHLAAHYTPARDLDSVDKLVESNLRLGAEVLEAMAEADCQRLVYATTASTHFACKSYSPLTLYAATKQAFSDLVTYYTSHGLIHAAAVAIADSYGPGDLRPKVLNLIRQSALNGTPVQLTSGKQPYDVVYIDDIVRGLICAANSLEHGPAHRFFQLHNKNALSLRETVELMLRTNGIHFQPEWGVRKDTAQHPAVAEPAYPPPPGWQPETPLAEGLHRFWNHNLK